MRPKATLTQILLRLRVGRRGVDLAGNILGLEQRVDPGLNRLSGWMPVFFGELTGAKNQLWGSVRGHDGWD